MVELFINFQPDALLLTRAGAGASQAAIAQTEATQPSIDQMSRVLYLSCMQRDNGSPDNGSVQDIKAD